MEKQDLDEITDSEFSKKMNKEYYKAIEKQNGDFVILPNDVLRMSPQFVHIMKDMLDKYFEKEPETFKMIVTNDKAKEQAYHFFMLGYRHEFFIATRIDNKRYATWAKILFEQSREEILKELKNYAVKKDGYPYISLSDAEKLIRKHTKLEIKYE